MTKENHKNKRKVILPIIFGLGVVFLFLGVSMAFFNYTRIGSPNRVATGRIYFNHQQGNTINLTNVFPISSEEAETDTEDSATVTITVTGDTDYDEGMEYVVTLSDVVNTVNNKKVPINLEVSVTGTGLGTEETGDYYTNRDSYTVSKYKKEYNGTLENGKHILVGYIAPNTTKGTASGINGTINIKAYIDSSKVLISDTYNNGNSPTDEKGTPVELGVGKTVFTTSEWSDSELSFKIKVEAREGIWVDLPTPGDCFITSDNGNNTITIAGYVQNEYEYTLNTDMTEEEIAACVTYNETHYGSSWLEEGESFDSYCRGTGTYSGTTFQQALDNNSFEEWEIGTMLDNNFIIANIVEARPVHCDTTDIIIPKKINNKVVTSIGEEAFRYDELTSVLIPNSVTAIGSNAFANNQLTSVLIPNSVTAIGSNAFANNQLTSVEIPNSVTTVGEHAFSNNSSLTTLKIDMTTIPFQFADSVGISTLTNLIIGDDVTTIGAEAFVSNRLTSVVIPNSVTSIGEEAFRNNGLTSVTIGNNVATIGAQAFVSNRLTSVVIPNSVTSIGGSAFGNNGLTSVTIGNNVATIGARAFEYNSLTSVVIPDSVTSIDFYAFLNNQLVSVTIGNGITSIERAFYKNNTSNPNLARITIDKTCNDIKNNLKYNGTNYYPWLSYNSPYVDSYSSGTTIYGSNNEVCDAY